jgi:hypothetical protein
VEYYARRWTKSEKELDSLSEWVKSIRAILKSRIKQCVSSILLRLIKEFNRQHDEYVMDPANKACNNIVYVCKANYYQCIIKELGINSAIGNRTYTPTAFFQR